MIANAQYEIQIVDTHELLETLVNVGVAAGTSQFNRTLVMRTEDELMAKYDALPKDEAKKYVDSLRNSLIQHVRLDGEPLKLVLGAYSYDFNPIL